MPSLMRIVQAIGRRIERRTWLQNRRAEGSYIHTGIEFTGGSAPYSRLSIGQNCVIECDVTVWLPEQEGAEARLTCADNVFIGRNTFLGAYVPITIEASVLIGAYCYLISANHCYARRDIPIVQQGFTGAPITVRAGAWIGTHVVVLPGVTIGQGAIVAAGSLVNKDIPDFEIWGGVPAKFIKARPE